jgi:hypothetical protein
VNQKTRVLAVGSESQSQSCELVEFPGSDYEPLIPEGQYRFKLIRHETVSTFDSPKLVLVCSIIDFGPHSETILRRYYCVERLVGKARRGGQCKHKRRGDFMLEYFSLFPSQARPRRLDRVSLDPFRNEVLIGSVRTVKHNSQQKKLPEQLRYSVIGSFVGVEAR